jgi:hypothetical protein
MGLAIHAMFGIFRSSRAETQPPLRQALSQSGGYTLCAQHDDEYDNEEQRDFLVLK